MLKKIIQSLCIVSLLFFFSYSIPVHAKAPNVMDCLKENAECEDTDTPSNELNKDKSELTSPDESKSDSLLFTIVKTFFALLLILALIYLLIKFLSKRNKLFHQIKALENIGGISVGQNKSIQIVRIGSKIYMVGVGENVEMLEEITDDEVKNELLHRDENDTNDFSPSNLLPSFLQGKKDGNSSSNETKSNFKHHFSNELEKLKQNRKNILMQKQKEDKHE